LPGMVRLLSAARHYFPNETRRSPSQYLFCVGPPSSRFRQLTEAGHGTILGGQN
jgi:hypothetical protein